MQKTVKKISLIFLAVIAIATQPICGQVIKGKILDEKGMPAAYAKLKISNIKYSYDAYTDQAGTFQISVFYSSDAYRIFIDKSGKMVRIADGIKINEKTPVYDGQFKTGEGGQLGEDDSAKSAGLTEGPKVNLFSFSVGTYYQQRFGFATGINLDLLRTPSFQVGWNIEPSYWSLYMNGFRVDYPSTRPVHVANLYTGPQLRFTFSDHLWLGAGLDAGAHALIDKRVELLTRVDNDFLMTFLLAPKVFIELPLQKSLRIRLFAAWNFYIPGVYNRNFRPVYDPVISGPIKLKGPIVRDLYPFRLGLMLSI